MQLASGLGTPQGVAVDGAFVYFTETTGNTVKKVAKSGGPVIVVASGQAQPFNVVADESAVYWTNVSSAALAVMRIAKERRLHVPRAGRGARCAPALQIGMPSARGVRLFHA